MTTPTLKELREKWEAADAVVRTIDPKPVSVSLTSIAGGEMAPWARAALGTCAADLRVHEAKAIAATALIAAYEARVGELEEVAERVHVDVTERVERLLVEERNDAIMAKNAAEAARDAAAARVEELEARGECPKGSIKREFGWLDGTEGCTEPHVVEGGW